jgi:hypothetical protein
MTDPSPVAPEKYDFVNGVGMTSHFNEMENFIQSCLKAPSRKKTHISLY